MQSTYETALKQIRLEQTEIHFDMDSGVVTEKEHDPSANGFQPGIQSVTGWVDRVTGKKEFCIQGDRDSLQRWHAHRAV